MATESLELDLGKVYGVFQTQYDFIRNVIKPFLGELAPMLFARKLIDPDTNSTAVNVSIRTGDRANTVMLVLDARIRAAPRDIYTLMEVLEKMPVLSAVTRRLHELLRGQQQQTSSHLALAETNVALHTLPNFPPEPAAYVTVTGTLALPSPTLPLQMAHPMNPSEPPSQDELVDIYGMKMAAMCSHVPSSTHHTVGLTHHPADPTHHPADPTLHPADPAHHPADHAHHPAGPTHHPADSTHHPAGPTHHPADPTLHPAGPTHHPVGPTLHSADTTHQLRKRDLTGPRVETGRVAVQQPSGDIAQPYVSYQSPFTDVGAHALSLRALPEPISITTTTMPLSPTSPTSDHMSPNSPISNRDTTPLSPTSPTSDHTSPTSPTSDRTSPTSPISNHISPASRSASVYPPSLQATSSETNILSCSHSTDSSGSTSSADAIHSALSSLSLSETDETLLKGAEKQLHDQLEKLRLRMSQKDMTNLQLERELKDTKAEKYKLEQLVLDLQKKVAEQEQELRERAQQATASSLAQIASLRKDLDEHLDATNRYLAQLIRSTCRSE